MEKIAQFLSELNEVQERYELYIVTQSEDEMLVSADRTPNNHQIVALTGHSSIRELDHDRVSISADAVRAHNVED